MEKVAKKLTRVVTRTGAGSLMKPITFEAASLAKFSDGSCTCSQGDTSVLVTAVSDRQLTKPNSGFTPMTVEYKQKAAAAGRIPMTHLRRDIGFTEREVLTSRMIDRAVRPMFAKGFCNETQIICNLLAVDGNNDPDVLAINGASASLAISDIPWDGPVGATRVGLIGEKLVTNPSRREQENSRLNLVLAANNNGNLMMMDGFCNEPVLLPDITKAIKQGIRECKIVIEAILKLQSLYGRPKRQLDLCHMPSSEHRDFAITYCQDKLEELLTNYDLEKIERGKAMDVIKSEFVGAAREKFPDIEQGTINEAFAQTLKIIYRKVLRATRRRCDGRMIQQVRPINCKVDLYKPLHGSALFQRGQTQVFCSTTFDSPDAAFRNDSLTSIVSGVKEKNFMLHYEFPPFATNEIGRVGVLPGRREIGHGALAENAVRAVIPGAQDMTIRLNCEVLESNGSSSMASVCAGSLSLMDAGVSLREHVAGVAMGLISDLSYNQEEATNDLESNTSKDADYEILTDILGLEDFLGDMDFKIAGTKRAITATHLDVKPRGGVPPAIIYQALQQAHAARSEIINIMEKTIQTPRKEKKDNHPVMKTMFIPQHKVASFVGFGGSNLKKIMATIGVRIAPHGEGIDNNELGVAKRDNFIVFAPNKEAMEEADELIKSLIEKQKEPELDFNAIYTATIQEIRPSGFMVTLYPSMTPALLPLSQLDIKKVSHPSALNFEVGQQIQVKYFGRDPATGQMRLSRKSLMMSSIAKVHRNPLG